MLLKKKIYQISLTAIVFACVSLFFINAALADGTNEIKVEICNDDWSVCEPLCIDEECTNSLALFESVNFLPGDTAERKVKITNVDITVTGSGMEQEIAIEAIEVDNPYLGILLFNDRFGDRLDFKVEENNGSVKYEKTLTEFFEESGETVIHTLANNTSKKFIFSVYFDETSDDKYQNKSLGFNIVFGLKGDEGGPPPSPGPGGGGGLPPGLIIKNVRTYDIPDDDIYDNFATVGFSWFTSYDATSQIIYSSECEYDGTCTVDNKKFILDLSDNQWDVGMPPKYGYAHTTPEYHTPANASGVTYRGESDNEIKIEGLKCDTVYYYRAISHASPPTISRAYSFRTPARADSGNGNGTDEDDEHTPNPSQEGNNSGADDGAYFGIGGIVDAASDFVDSILKSEKEEDRKGEVAGIADENSFEIGNETGGVAAGECGKYPEYLLWLIALLLIIIMILLYYIYQSKKKKEEIRKENEGKISEF